MKVFVIDAAKCNGCYGCQLACKDEHVDNEWMPYARPQPDTGHFWLKMNETVHGQVPKVKIEYVPRTCMHCDQAQCIEAGQGAVYKRDDGLVIIDPQKATGRNDLVESCPYGAIYWNDALQIPQKCTGCAHLTDKGEVPHCVDLCPTGALRFGEEADFAAEIAQAEVMLPELGLKPRVYYLNLPKLFLAGDVYDEAADEIIENAEIALTCHDTGAKRLQRSDDFGDFWFKVLDKGSYSLQIEAEGYAGIAVDNIALDKSLNLGSFALKKHA